MGNSSSDADRRSVELSADHARYIDRLVETGAYSTDSEVVTAGLEALLDRDATLERWLVEEAVPTYDLMVADPQRGIPSDEVRDRLKAKHEERLRAERR